MRLTDLALHHRNTVVFLTAGVVVLGLLSYATLPRESNPDISIPVILALTPYPGASPLDVERQVTNHLERHLRGLEGLETMASTSSEGASTVTLEFASGSDLESALQKVRDRVDVARVDLPREAERPQIQEVNFSRFPVLQVHLSGDVGPVVLKRLAEDLQDELESLSGVLEVGLTGGLEREVRVAVDPEKLRLYGLALDDVVDAIADENVSMPAGTIELGSQSIAVRIPGEVEDPLRVADFVIRAPGGSPVFVRDVASVSFSFKDRVSYARINGVDSVALAVQKRLGANVVEVIQEIEASLDRLHSQLPAGVEVTLLSDESKMVRMMLKDLENNILSGLLLVVLVLVSFLGARAALFAGLAIPLSMMATFVVLDLTGITLNMVVLFSLVLAVGMLVDNGVVVIENIDRHLREGVGPRAAASQATREVGAAIAVSTFTTVGAFVPLLFWPGVMGDFMSYLPLTVSIALLASLAVALTVNPVLCSRFLRPSKRRESTSMVRRVEARVLEGYSRFLQLALRRRRRVLLAAACMTGLIVGAFWLFSHGVEFLPEAEPSRIFVDLEAPPGTRLSKTDALVQVLEERLQSVADVETLAATAGLGGGERSDQGGTAHRGRVSLDLAPLGRRTQNSFLTLNEIRRRVTGVPGAGVTVSHETLGPSHEDPLTIEFEGEDFATLGRIATRARGLLRDLPGLVSLDDDFDLARPEMLVLVDRTQAARLGLTTDKVARTVRTAINGIEASTVRVDGEEVDVRVRFAEAARQSIADLETLTVATKEGNHVPLAAVARLERSSALPSIRHQDQKRIVSLTGKVIAPRYARPVREEARRRLNEAEGLMPAGYSWRFGGQSDDENESRDFLIRALLYALIVVFALILGKFNSFVAPLIVLSSVLLSMLGVLAGLLVTGLPFGIVMTGLGVISLAGIVVNNSIVLLDYGERLWAKGLTRREVVVETGVRRARPVLMTATTTILGLIPLSTGVEFDFRSLSFSSGGESSQYWRPMGVAVIFGLGFATFLTLILVPVLYDFWLERREGRERRRRSRRTVLRRPLPMVEEEEREPVPELVEV